MIHVALEFIPDVEKKVRALGLWIQRSNILSPPSERVLIRLLFKVRTVKHSRQLTIKLKRRLDGLFFAFCKCIRN